MISIKLLNELNYFKFFKIKIKKKETTIIIYLFLKKKNFLYNKNNFLINQKPIDLYFKNIVYKYNILNIFKFNDLYKYYNFAVICYIKGGGLINQYKTIINGLNKLFIKKGVSKSSNIKKKKKN